MFRITSPVVFIEILHYVQNDNYFSLYLLRYLNYYFNALLSM